MSTPAATSVPAAVPGPAPAPSTGGQRRYGVLVGGARLLLAADGAVRVLEQLPVFRLPNTRAWFLGIANVRGALIPVYDLAAWQALPLPATRRMLLVIGEGDCAAAILTDESPRLLAVSRPAAAPVPLPQGLSAHATGTFDTAHGPWTALEWNALFAHLKTAAIAH